MTQLSASQPAPTGNPEIGPGNRGAAAADAGDAIVECVGLTKIFRDFWLRNRVVAVDGLDLQVRRGEVFGLLGPNGSGKSTTIKLILGLLHPTAGVALVLGKSPHNVAIKRHVGYLPEETYLYRFLNARETLDYYGRLYGLNRHQRQARTETLLEMVGLQDVRSRPVGMYSKGMQRRIGLAQALINDPELLILDEPTSGLDPLGTRQIKDLTLELARRGKTVILCSHLLADVEDVCDRVAIMFGGQVRAAGSVDELLVRQDVTTIQTQTLQPELIDKVDALLSAHGRQIDRVEQPRQKLESLFLKIVREAEATGTDTSGATTGGEIASFLADETSGVDSDRAPSQSSTQLPAIPAPPFDETEIVDVGIESEADKRPTTEHRVEDGPETSHQPQVAERAQSPDDTRTPFENRDHSADSTIIDQSAYADPPPVETELAGPASASTEQAGAGLPVDVDMSVIDQLLSPDQPSGHATEHPAPVTVNESAPVPEPQAEEPATNPAEPSKPSAVHATEPEPAPADSAPPVQHDNLPDTGNLEPIKQAPENSEAVPTSGPEAPQPASESAAPSAEAPTAPPDHSVSEQTDDSSEKPDEAFLSALSEVPPYEPDDEPGESPPGTASRP